MATAQLSPLSILMAAQVPRRREGGGATIIYNLGRELEKRGHSVTYIFSGRPVRPGQNFPTFQRALVSPAAWTVTSPKPRQILDRQYSCSLPVSFYGIHRHWFGSRDLPPYVMTLHGLEERRIHVQSREAKKGRAWNFNLRNRLWHRFYTFPLYRWAIRTADGAHTYSRDVWNILQLKYNLDSDRTAYIPNGVEPRFFLPRRYDSFGPLKLLYAGTWLDQRGIFYLRDALERLAPQLPGMTMTFAGCGCPSEVIKDFFGPNLASTVVVQSGCAVRTDA